MALDILRRTLDQRQDLQAAVDTVLGMAAPGPETGLATELAYGYLRLRGRLDFLLSLLLKNPVQTSPALKRILGLAAYELLFLGGVPEYATLDWAVSLTKKRLGQTMANVVNGVLRNLIRLGPDARHADLYRTRTTGVVPFLAAWYSCPAWLARMWIAAYGQEQTELFLRATLSPPPVGVRINQTHPGAPDLRRVMQQSSACPGDWSCVLHSWTDFMRDAVSNGVATRQSLAAQSIMGDLDVARWPDPILDACAGRGGKAFLMAELGKTVWASDINVFRLRQLRSESRRLGLAVPAFLAPGQGPYPLRIAPQTVFLDAPCSGLGVLARRPDIKWKRTPEDCAGLAELQREILAGAAGLLPSGGHLVYVTCTLHPDENQTQIQRFLALHPQFSLLIEVQTATDSGLGEFFYGAAMRKK